MTHELKIQIRKRSTCNEVHPSLNGKEKNVYDIRNRKRQTDPREQQQSIPWG